VTRRALSQAKR